MCRIILYALFFISACSEEDKFNEVGQLELISRIKDKTAPLILDIRSEKEYINGHVPGAKLILFNNYKQQLVSMNIAKNKEIVVYCEAGFRAKKAQNYLKKQGYFEVRHLQGDMLLWRKSNLEIEKQ